MKVKNKLVIRSIVVFIVLIAAANSRLSSLSLNKSTYDVYEKVAIQVTLEEFEDDFTILEITFK